MWAPGQTFWKRKYILLWENTAFILFTIKKLVTAHPEAVDFIIFGHSHKYFHEQQGKTCWLNPGSCGRARFHLPLTMATLELSDNGYEIQCIHIENNKSTGKALKTGLSRSIYSLFPLLRSFFFVCFSRSSYFCPGDSEIQFKSPGNYSGTEMNIAKR